VPGHLRFHFDQEVTNKLLQSGYQLDTSHRFQNLFYGEDTEEVRDLKAQYHYHRAEDQEENSPLRGTIAQQPEFYGTMKVGFYSAYYTEVTPITIFDYHGNRRFTN
jgi:hypothetical protein